MTASKCTCVYATASNTESVRLGYEMGGYLKHECEACKSDRQSKPAGTFRKIAHYFYPGAEIVISACDGWVRIRHPDGSLPFDPCHGKPHPHPNEELEEAPVLTYEEVGLYYGYAMPDTVWSDSY